MFELNRVIEIVRPILMSQFHTADLTQCDYVCIMSNVALTKSTTKCIIKVAVWLTDSLPASTNGLRTWTFM